MRILSIILLVVAAFLSCKSENKKMFERSIAENSDSLNNTEN
jgi:hypothetical protein